MKPVDRNADELSDLSENDVDSDVTLDESSSEEQDVSDDVSDGEDGWSEARGSEELDEEEEGFFNREGHFVVPERARPAVVGAVERTRRIPVASDVTPVKPTRTRPKKEISELSVQTDIDATVVNTVAPTGSRMYSKRKLSDDAVMTSSSEEETDDNVDPVFVVRPQRVTKVMEGGTAEWTVELRASQPVGELTTNPTLSLPVAVTYSVRPFT